MTIQNADKIVVIDKGQVIEEGDHDSLMNARGTYYDLVEQQKWSSAKQEEQQGFEQHTSDVIMCDTLTDEHRIGLEQVQKPNISSLVPSIKASSDDKKRNQEDTEEDDVKIKNRKKRVTQHK